MEAVQAFYDDLIWAFTHELDGIRWWDGQQLRHGGRIGGSLTAAVADLGTIWGLDVTGKHSGPRQYRKRR